MTRVAVAGDLSLAACVDGAALEPQALTVTASATAATADLAYTG
jgi:hypothetical protein